MSYTEEDFLDLGKGNPGAMNFLAAVDSLPEGEDKDLLKSVVRRTESLRGTNLYILHNDLCGRDMDKVVKLVRNCPIEILEDAFNWLGSLR